MSKFKIGIGKCSIFFLYILGSSIFKCLRDCLFNFTSLIFGFEPVLSNHSTIKKIYMYLSYIIFGLCFFYISKRKNIIKKENKEKQITSLSNYELIYNNMEINIEFKRMIQLILVCLIFVLHSDLIKILYLFKINDFDIWTFGIVFASFFMKQYFDIKFFKHQKYALLFIIIICTSLLILSTFFENKNNKNVYEIIDDLMGSYFYFIPIVCAFMLITCMTSFGCVVSKVLMDLTFISPYKIIILTGIIGLLLNSISLVITTSVECKTNNKIILGDFCLSKYNGNKYYDNINAYFSDLKNEKQIYLEIFLVTPIYLIVCFLEFTCEIFIIYHLNPIYILIRDNLYYGTSRIISVLYNIDEYTIHITLSKCIILELAEIFAIFGYLIYLEIIELRCFGLDKDLKRNIILRGEVEALGFLMSEDDNDDEDDDIENNNITEMV